jgi:acetyltransferase
MQMNVFDPSLDVLQKRPSQLDSIFMPKNVAVIGATEKEGSVGKTVFLNLINSSFGGKVYPVNPKRDTVLGIKAYSSVKLIPEKVDLAVVVIPAQGVLEVIQECVEMKIPSAIIISAGFKELGKEGEEREKKILAAAKKGKMRIIGPNCLGVMNPLYGLNATFASGIALKGNIAFISQSGALCTAVLDWSYKEKIGFSSFVSVGSMADVGWGDLIDYLGNDPHTKSILIYMESIGNARAFLSAARQVALNKPIILIKAGTTSESAKAASSHTGALSGSDEVFTAALKRVGVLRVDTISELFSMAEILAKQPLPKGPNLTIITNAGGPGVIATDALVKNGGKLTPISNAMKEELNTFLPQEWSHNNPIDILGDASKERYEKTLQTVAKDEATNGIMVILTPQYMTDATGIAEKLKQFGLIENKPILASWMGSSVVQKGIEVLTEAQIPHFSYPDEACKAFAYMWRYSKALDALYETPVSFVSKGVSKKAKEIAHVQKIIAEARKNNHLILSEHQAKEILKAFHIPVVTTEVAKTKEEAIQIAEKLGFPVVVKLYSHIITHKTDVGGVKINLQTVDEVKNAFDEIQKNAEKAHAGSFEGVSVQNFVKMTDGYELILGSSIDPQFGPVVLFGMGGQLVEVYKDSALALPPLTSTLAQNLMEKTKIYNALRGVRGRKSVNLRKLQEILVNFSNLLVEFPEISECDINPLAATPDQIIALDARIVLHDPKIPQEKLPKVAIRPYPQQYVEEWKLKNQKMLTIRPIRPEDEPYMAQFFKHLSEKSVLERYFQVLSYDELTKHERLIGVCFNDYDREIALVCENEEEKKIIAVARFFKIPSTQNASFSILIQDEYHHQGLGTYLVKKLMQIAKEEKIEHLIATMRKENQEMKKICEKNGFVLKQEKNTPYIVATKVIE